MAITAGAMPGYTLASNASATGDPILWPGGKGSFFAQATWGGGSVKLQYMGPNGTDYEDVGSDTSLTADGGGNFELPKCYIRAAITTATAVYATVASRE